MGVDGKKVWLHHDKNLVYVFEGSTVRITTSWCEFTIDFNPAAEEIQAYEVALGQLEAKGDHHE
jgi:hypothetical protein